MNFTIDTLDGDVRGTVQSLLPPSAKNMVLLHGFSYEPPRNPGHTYRVQAGEHAVASGDGKVTAVKRRPNEFRHSTGLLDTDATWQITIYHGYNVYSTVQGLVTVAVQVGTPVVAGQDIGVPLTGEIFFQVLYHATPYDPTTISRFFRAYDGGKVPEKRGMVHQGTDLLDRPAEEVQLVIEGDVRYFVDIYCRKEPILLNIDFAGTGSKTGFAAIGHYGTDTWNVYTHSALTTTDGTLCIEVLPQGHDSTGTLSLFNGTLFECLHSGTLSGTTSLFQGTLVECLRSGTVSESVSVYTGTLTEHLLSGTSSSAISVYSGSLILDDPMTQLSGSLISVSTGTVASLLVLLVGTVTPETYPFPEVGGSAVYVSSGTVSPLPP